MLCLERLVNIYSKVLFIFCFFHSSLFDVFQLISSLLNVILSTDMVKLQIQCLGIITYFIQSRKTNSLVLLNICIYRVRVFSAAILVHVCTLSLTNC